MSTSGINTISMESSWKQLFAGYITATCFSILVNQVYGIFGHGVSSASMSYMFLYPMVAGLVSVSIFRFFALREHAAFPYRLFRNLLGSGIATLTVGGFLTGIFEIAGTSSPYMIGYRVTGWLLVILSIVVLLAMLFREHMHN